MAALAVLAVVERAAILLRVLLAELTLAAVAVVALTVILAEMAAPALSSSVIQAHIALHLPRQDRPLLPLLAVIEPISGLLLVA
jgi:hypothetical protein